MADSS
jgi:inorganic pyrophosphatase